MRNIVTDTIVFVFLLVCDEIVNPIYWTMERSKNTFGGWRIHRREDTVQECVELEDDRRHKVNENYESSSAVSWSPQSGYQAASMGFAETPSGGDVSISNDTELPLFKLFGLISNQSSTILVKVWNIICVIWYSMITSCLYFEKSLILHLSCGRFLKKNLYYTCKLVNK